jgi:hypothetical protein
MRKYVFMKENIARTCFYLLYRKIIAGVALKGLFHEFKRSLKNGIFGVACIAKAAAFKF